MEFENKVLSKHENKRKRFHALVFTTMAKKDIPRIELGLLDSKSNVLTITPYVLINTKTAHNFQMLTEMTLQWETSKGGS